MQPSALRASAIQRLKLSIKTIVGPFSNFIIAQDSSFIILPSYCPYYLYYVLAIN